MSVKDEQAEQRLLQMKDFYLKIENLIDQIPDSIPPSVVKKISNALLGDKNLRELMDSIDQQRPPRIFLIGRTGVGKSSLINALSGSYTALVSDTRSCTRGAEAYQVKEGDRVLMEILDTRGTAESKPAALDSEKTAEDQLREQIAEFTPDVAVFMLNCVHRDDVNEDIAFLKSVADEYVDLNKTRLPIVTVVNKCDEMAPSRYKDPAGYPKQKVEKIREVVDNYRQMIEDQGLKAEDVIGVSALIDWQTADGEEIDAEAISELTPEEIAALQPAFDGRWHIDELKDALIGAISDVEAKRGTRMAVRLNEVIHQAASGMIKIFSGIASTVALTPIPIADMYVLWILQAILVAMIAALSGRDLTINSAKEFLLSLGGVAGAGYGFRMIAHEAPKLLNNVFPGAGSVISSGVAGYGTELIGRAAVSYYLDGQTMKEVRRSYNFSGGRSVKNPFSSLNKSLEGFRPLYN